MFADDTSLLSVTHDITIPENELINDLKKISDWVFQWNIIFNPKPSKQAQEVIFSGKSKKVSYLHLVFNNDNFSSSKSQRHLGILLDSKLTFEERYQTTLSKTSEDHDCYVSSKSTLIAIYETFVRLYLDYEHILYDQASMIKHRFIKKLESIQYNACLTLTATIRDT